MPELPEVEALSRFLRRELTGRAFVRFDLAALAALKTYALPLDSLLGLEIESVERHGKFICVGAQGVWLSFHLARAGWLRWYDVVPEKPIRPGRHPIALRAATDAGSGFDLTEAGTQKKLAIYVTSSPGDVPGIASLGVEVLGNTFTPAVLDAVLDTAGRAQIKGVLRDQSVLAGIGNAYSDEILHRARLSPFAPSSGLDADQRAVLFAAIVDTLSEAIGRADGLPPSELKDSKRQAMRVHGRTGLPCPVCQTPVAEVSFADSALQYCPTCQTGGRLLADRRMSRLLK